MKEGGRPSLNQIHIHIDFCLAATPPPTSDGVRQRAAVPTAVDQPPSGHFRYMPGMTYDYSENIMDEIRRHEVIRFLIGPR
jgi:hypothetical protein